MFAPLQFVGGIIWSVLFVPPMAYITWALIGIGVGVWFVLKYYKSAPQDFELERFGEVVNRDLEKGLDVLGVRTHNALLLKGLTKIGDIAKMLHEKGIITKEIPLEPDGKPSLATNSVLMAEIKKNSPTSKSTIKRIPFDLHIFEVNVGDSLLNIFGKGNERIVIDTNLVKFDPVRNFYQINENANLWRFGDVWVSSMVGADFVTDIAWKRGLENQVEETMNLAKKTTYLEMKHSKKVDIMEKETELQQAKYQQYKKTALLEEED